MSTRAERTNKLVRRPDRATFDELAVDVLWTVMSTGVTGEFTGSV